MNLRIPDGILTKRLFIRPHTLEDMDPFAEFMTDDVATRYLDFDPEQRTSRGARELLEYVIASYETDSPVFALAMTDRSNKAFLGSCGLSPLGDEEKAVECYFSLLPRYWGWGYASEAMEALMYFAFREMDVETVVLNINRENARAIKVAEAAGLENQGEVKYRDFPGGVRYAISRDHYNATRRRKRVGRSGEKEA
jgi:ribosomal-protein-alanine N-acetyltransferase